MDVRNLRLGSRCWIALLTALGLFIAALLPSPLRRHPEFGTVGPDKLLHFLGHAGLAAALADALASDRPLSRKTGTLAVVGSVAHGLVTGFAQRYVPGRAFERADLVAGVLGSVCGVLARYSTERDTRSDGLSDALSRLIAFSSDS